MLIIVRRNYSGSLEVVSALYPEWNLPVVDYIVAEIKMDSSGSVLVAV